MNKALKITAGSVIAIALTACSSNKSILPIKKADYQSENNKIVSLEVPPDLYNPTQSNLYQLPNGTLANPNALAQARNGQTRVLNKVENIHFERSANQRWLVIDDKTASEVWPLLRAFWQENGFTIANEEPRAGLMETDWAENRAKLSNQGLRRIFDRIGLGGVYSTGERDKFLVRIEHNSKGGLDIFFIHKGMEEIYTNRTEDTVVWKPRSNDPNLEAAMLARFMQYLGADETEITQQLEQKSTKKPIEEFAKLEVDSVLVYGRIQRNVNRIGLALDRIGLTVHQYIPERGMFIVRPAPMEAPSLSEAKNKKPGIIRRTFNRLFGRWMNNGGKTENLSTATTQAAQMFVILEEVENGQRVSLLDQFGQSYHGNDSSTWLNELYKELR